jgi:NAD(P)-dependent dehydrogenase (short-subunit alcohol dehydrogenase family)
MAGKLEGQVAWVTGGASGMGEAIARLFAREGAQVVVVDVQERKGKEVAARIVGEGGLAIFSACDVSRGQEVERSIAETGKSSGSS